MHQIQDSDEEGRSQPDFYLYDQAPLIQQNINQQDEQPIQIEIDQQQQSQQNQDVSQVNSQQFVRYNAQVLLEQQAIQQDAQSNLLQETRNHENNELNTIRQESANLQNQQQISVVIEPPVFQPVQQQKHIPYPYGDPVIVSQIENKLVEVVPQVKKKKPQESQVNQSQISIGQTNQNNSQVHPIRQSSSRISASIKCKHCNDPLKIRIEYKINMHTVFVGFLIALCLSPICCWIPCVSRSCKNKVEVCRNCGGKIRNIKKYSIC